MERRKDMRNKETEAIFCFSRDRRKPSESSDPPYKKTSNIDVPRSIIL